MTLIAVLVALFFERFVGSLDEMRGHGWYLRYAGWLRSRGGRTGIMDGPAGILSVLILPVLAVALAMLAVDGLMLGLVEILIGIVVLLFCLGPRDLDEAVESWVEAVAANDTERMRREAADLLHGEMPEDPAQRARGLAAAVFSEANRRLFSVLFWFIVLGPVGAVLYRCASLLEAPKDGEATAFHASAERLVAILDWIPARLTALGYALCGSFDPAFAVLRREMATHEVSAEQNRRLLATSGGEAMQIDALLAGKAGEEGETPAHAAVPEAAAQLVLRVLLAYVAVLAFMTLGNWIS